MTMFNYWCLVNLVLFLFCPLIRVYGMEPVASENFVRATSQKYMLWAPFEKTRSLKSFWISNSQGRLNVEARVSVPPFREPVEFRQTVSEWIQNREGKLHQAAGYISAQLLDRSQVNFPYAIELQNADEFTIHVAEASPAVVPINFRQWRELEGNFQNSLRPEDPIFYFLPLNKNEIFSGENTITGTTGTESTMDLVIDAPNTNVGLMTLSLTVAASRTYIWKPIPDPNVVITKLITTAQSTDPRLNRIEVVSPEGISYSVVPTVYAENRATDTLRWTAIGCSNSMEGTGPLVTTEYRDLIGTPANGKWKVKVSVADARNFNYNYTLSAAIKIIPLKTLSSILK